jgi:hypothetical protein
MEPSPEDPSHRQTFEQLKQLYPRYSFDSQRHGAQLADITLLAVAAPTAAGKSTLINETLAIDDDIHMYQSSTTRPPEARDRGEYRHVPIEAFAEAAAERSLVNYFPHPNGHIYGTFTSGFKAPITIGAIATASMEQLFDAPFRDVRAVYTLTDGPTYASRLGLESITDTNNRMHSPDIRKRLVESLQSLEFATANASEDWFTAIQLTNGPGSLQRSARNLARIGHERSAESLSVPYARHLAQEMGAVAREAIARLDAVQ